MLLVSVTTADMPVPFGAARKAHRTNYREIIRPPGRRNALSRGSTPRGPIPRPRAVGVGYSQPVARIAPTRPAFSKVCTVETHEGTDKGAGTRRYSDKIRILDRDRRDGHHGP